MKVRLNSGDYIWSYIGTIVSMGAGIIMLPFILYYLTEDMYGLWGIFQSIAAITILFDFGFSITFARNINYCWCGATDLKKTGVAFAESDAPNFSLMKRTIITCRYVFLLLSSIALVCMAIPGTIYIQYICRDLSGKEPMIAWGFYVVAIFLNLYYCYYNAFLRGVGAVTAANRAMVIAKVVQILLTIIFLMQGLGIIGVGAAFLTYGIIYRILCKWEFERFHDIGKYLKQVKERPSRNELKELFDVIWYNAKREGIVTLSSYLANQACSIIGPIFLSLSTMGSYILAGQLVTALVSIAGTLYTANQPVLQSAYISKNKELTKRTMSLIIVTYVLVFVVGMVAIILLGLPILRRIKPDTIPSVGIMLGVGLYQFILKFRDCYTSYFSCTNRIIYVKAFITASLFCVLMVVALLYSGFGIKGLIFAQIFSQIIYNFWHWPILAHKEMELPAKETCRLGAIEIKTILAKVCIK